MRNMLDKTNQKLKNIERKNNKGFTLVELIIVIAIIAVLAAVLAPQYIKYVEKSRIANDNQMAESVLSEVNVALTDASEEGVSINAGTITVSKANGNAATVVDTGNISTYITTGIDGKGKIDANFMKAKVSNTKGTPGVTFTITYTGTQVTESKWNAA